MYPIIFDTSVYISALRQGNESILGTRNLAIGSVLWLSAVVLQELYAGANARARKQLNKFEREFAKIGRLLVPEASDWSGAGNILSHIGEKYGYDRIGRSRLTNDALIATSASRRGIVLITANERDFHLIAEFCSLTYQII